MIGFIGSLLWVTVVLTLIVIAVVIVARLLFRLPPRNILETGKARPASMATELGRITTPLVACHPGLSGIAALGEGNDAFAARMILVDAAEDSIDAQYYIWHGDLTGTLLLDALWRAAERGVRVRLLLDDNGTSGLDHQIAQLVSHANVQVRLYNPFNLRRFKVLSYGFDFFRLNRRMHNKCLVIDGAVAVLGGRNIGDEYFDTGLTPLYVDLDVLTVGRVVPEIAADFDRYWNAPPVHPAGPIVGAPPATDPIAQDLARYRSDPQFATYKEQVGGSQLVQRLARGTLDLEWTDAVLVSDTPAKGEGAVAREDLLASRLTNAVGEIADCFDGISPYFVPSKAGVRAFATLAERGVKVRMLTNSLEATDVLPVHAGYAKHRRDLLNAGVEVFELRKRIAVKIPVEETGPFGSSGASLHAKTFAVDRARVFVGSFNFDPRSTTLNTELGLLIDSPPMAGRIHDAFDRALDRKAWRVRRDGSELVWEVAEEDPMRHEPGTNLPRRVALWTIGKLPVEWLL
ncbi:phospholipase D family protein [Marivita sp. S0852]|uniref:phospholipase D family protein n=1 Tax=Marivita sp. S0852 TaxID=3373893 RepID=UPI0039827C96